MVKNIRNSLKRGDYIGDMEGEGNIINLIVINISKYDL